MSPVGGTFRTQLLKLMTVHWVKAGSAVADVEI
jgi:hypothetical protein